MLTSAFNKAQSAIASLPSSMPSVSRIRRSNRTGIEMISPDYNRRLELPSLHQLIHRQPELGPFAVAEPANPGGQTLKMNSLARQLHPAGENFALGKSSSASLSVRSMSAGSPLSATQRNGPFPSQNSGRIYSGTKPGISKAFSQPPFFAWVRMLLP